MWAWLSLAQRLRPNRTKLVETSWAKLAKLAEPSSPSQAELVEPRSPSRARRALLTEPSQVRRAETSSSNWVCQARLTLVSRACWAELTEPSSPNRAHLAKLAIPSSPSRGRRVVLMTRAHEPSSCAEFNNPSSPSRACIPWQAHWAKHDKLSLPSSPNSLSCRAEPSWAWFGTLMGSLYTWLCCLAHLLCNSKNGWNCTLVVFFF